MAFACLDVVPIKTPSETGFRQAQHRISGEGRIRTLAFRVMSPTSSKRWDRLISSGESEVAGVDFNSGEYT